MNAMWSRRKVAAGERLAVLCDIYTSIHLYSALYTSIHLYIIHTYVHTYIQLGTLKMMYRCIMYRCIVVYRHLCKVDVRALMMSVYDGCYCMDDLWCGCGGCVCVYG